MAEYNLQSEKGINKFEIYNGRNIEQMPKLIADNRIPMSVAGLMQRRLELRDSDDASVRDFYMNNYFDTVDGALYMPDGNLVLVYDAKVLREMTPESKLVGGALNLEGFNTDDIEDRTYFNKQELEKMILGEDLTLRQARNHPVWFALARGDKNLQGAYAEMIFKDNDYCSAMGIYLDSSLNIFKMRALYVYGADGRSDAFGGGHIDNVDGRLVGLASETQE
ncbi:MAG: hypothetical protein IH845_05585 [Nanoarchaeota archaeon]|nr:hypothetical protein [Nanoarchaeota archaeon]